MHLAKQRPPNSTGWKSQGHCDGLHANSFCQLRQHAASPLRSIPGPSCTATVRPGQGLVRNSSQLKLGNVSAAGFLTPSKPLSYRQKPVHTLTPLFTLRRGSSHKQINLFFILQLTETSEISSYIA